MHIASSSSPQPKAKDPSSHDLKKRSNQDADQDSRHTIQKGYPALSSVQLLFSGAMAGGVAKTVTAPIDRIKILYQVSPTRVFTVKNALKTTSEILQTSGVPGLWRGNMAQLYRVLPYSACMFYTFDSYHQTIIEQTRTEGILSRFIAGGLAGTTATTLTYPLDLVRARMAANMQANNLYQTALGSARHVVKKEGILALFSGLHPTLIGIIPYSGVSFATFETLKSKYCQWQRLESNRDIPNPVRFFFGAISGFVAQTVTYPLHIVRRRMQVHGAKLAKIQQLPELPPSMSPQVLPDASLKQRATIMGTLKSIYLQEGFQGLFKGLSLNWIKGPVAVAVSLSLNDAIKIWMKKETRTHHMEGALRKAHDPKETESRELTAFQSLFAGGTGGALAKTVIAPMDRVKILYQVNHERKFSTKRALRSAKTIVSNTGITGLWRGHGATILRIVPYASISFATFDKYQRFLQKHVSNKYLNKSHTSSGDITVRFLAGALAGGTATTFTYPLDVLRARMAAHWSIDPKYTSYPNAVRDIIRTEGAISLYYGLAPTMMGILPYAGTSFALFESAKAYLVKYNQYESDREISVPLRLTTGAVSGLIAQSATYPLDIIRRRMQVHPTIYTSMAETATKIWHGEGYRGFYKGLSMNWIKGPIAVAISFTTNDTIKNRFRRQRLAT